MTIDLHTLKCEECGSSALRRIAPNQYQCEHCGSVSIVEDDVSQRLDQVLEQVKNAAGERLAAEQRVRQQQAMRYVALGAGALVAFVVLTLVVSTFVGSRGGAGVASLADRPIPAAGLRLDEARQVLVGSGASARPKLLVVAHNTTGEVLDRPTVVATYYDGADKLGSRSESLPVDLLGPNEAAPVLLDLPDGDRSISRQELGVERLSRPSRSVAGPRLAFARVRLVQQKGSDVRLVGRLVNTRQDATLAAAQVLVTLYDGNGALIGFGRAYAHADALKPGERTTLEVNIDRFGGKTPIAAWSYRIGYDVASEGGGRTSVVGPDRDIRTAGPPETLNPALAFSTEDLLADDSERFDMQQLELLPLIPGMNTIRQRTYMSELVNHSKDQIAVAPAAAVARFDGHTLDGTTAVEGPAYLYPGERFPVQIDPDQADNISQTRIEWKPARRAALPGPRQALQVKVDSSRAEMGSVLLNFTQRFAYKAVLVKGSVLNPGTGIVRKARIWVSLRDRDGRLTGFKRVENLPAIGPGESVPFEARIEQQGRDFATVEAVYQSTE
ncbi:MAG: FxLYD domain-containing protein [Pseudomonadota bacterium]